MRIDLPQCNFKNCKYCFDGNCTSKKQYERCDYLYARAEAISEFAERLKTTLIANGIYPVIVKNSIEKIAKELLEGKK